MKVKEALEAFTSNNGTYFGLFWIAHAITSLLKLSRGEIIGVKFGNRQTEKFFDTIYGGMRIFSFS